MWCWNTGLREPDADASLERAPPSGQLGKPTACTSIPLTLICISELSQPFRVSGSLSQDYLVRSHCFSDVNPQSG